MTFWTPVRVPRNVVTKEMMHNRDNLISTFDKMFDEIFRSSSPDLHKSLGIDPFSRSAFPKVNVVSHEDKVVIEAEIAGYSKDDISVEVEEDILSISGKASQSSEQTDKCVYLIRELKRSQFSRSFRLNEQLDANSIDASFKDGILEISIPKIEVEEKPTINKVTIK